MSSAEVVIWYCRLDAARVPAALLDELPADQALRLGQMTRHPGRQLRLLAWWLRNRLLAEELGVAPADLELVEGPHGKPALAGGELQFNLSHTPGCVAVAAGPLPLGIDVEGAARRAEWSRLARRMFAPAEQATLEAAGEDRRPRLAAALWSAREAWAKAGGHGVSGMAADPPFALVDGRWQPPSGRFWQTALPRHVLSVAVPGGGPELAAESFEVSVREGPRGWQLRRVRRDLEAE